MIHRKARELRLLNSREVRRGTLAAGRVDVASKSGQWLLSLEQNQAEVPWGVCWEGWEGWEDKDGCWDVG